MPYERYATIIEAHELAEMYQLNPLYSNMAYELFEKTKYPLKQCFQYVDEIRAYGGDFDDEDYELFEDTKGKTPEERFGDVVLDPFYQFHI